MVKKTILATLYIALNSVVVVADGGYTDWGTVTKIGNDWNGYTVFFTGAKHVGLDIPCNQADVRIQDGSNNEDKMFSIALAAMMSGKEIRVRVDKCEQSYQQARFIEIRN